MWPWPGLQSLFGKLRASQDWIHSALAVINLSECTSLVKLSRVTQISVTVDVWDLIWHNYCINRDHPPITGYSASLKSGLLASWSVVIPQWALHYSTVAPIVVPSFRPPGPPQLNLVQQSFAFIHNSIWGDSGMVAPGPSR